MINEGLELIKHHIGTRVGLYNNALSSTSSAFAATTSPDDLSPHEIFYASTSSNIRSSESSLSDTGNSMTFVVDSRRAEMDSETDAVARRRYENSRVAKEKAVKKHREFMKNHIDQTLGGDDAYQPLSRYLHRTLREKATVEKLSSYNKKTPEEKDEEDEIFAKDNKRVCYLSFSYLVDGVWPIVDGLNKKRLIVGLLRKYFKRLPERKMLWSMADAERSVVGTIFSPVTASSLYEDNLQRLLLPSAFRFRMETQKINPRGGILAYVAMFAPDHDPIVEVSGGGLTTLRGMFNNLLDGSLYEGHSISSLKEMEVDPTFDDGDTKTFCDRVLRASFHAVMLTMIGVKAWLPERYPDNRFVAGEIGEVSIRLPFYKEVIYDEKDGTWVFNTKTDHRMCYVKEFNSLLHYLSYPEDIASSCTQEMA